MNGHSSEYIGILTEQEIEEMEAEQEYYLLMQMEGNDVREQIRNQIPERDQNNVNSSDYRTS